MVLRTVRFNLGSYGSMFFWHKEVLKVKRTEKMRGSWLTESDRTVRSGFKTMLVCM